MNPNEEIEDKFGHGTEVTGIISAGKFKEGNIGIAPNVQLYDVKVLNDKGKTDYETVIRGIEWCINNNIQIINMSFGFESNNLDLERAINRALDKGIIIVAASGNSLGLRVDYPAKYDGVISVSALKEDLTRYSYSGKGKIDYAAPGVNILTTNNKGGYTIVHGTSFASAFVTGSIAALIGDSEEEVNNNNIEELLNPYIHDLGSLGYDEEFGHGLIKIN